MMNEKPLSNDFPLNPQHLRRGRRIAEMLEIPERSMIRFP